MNTIFSNHSIKFILILTLSVLSSCQKQSDLAEITLINPEEMKTLLLDKDVQLVDVRSVKEFNEHYIQGAENIVFDENFDIKLDNLDKEKPVVVYCKKGGRSARCAKVLQERGFKKIYDLEGGLTQWIKEGNEVQ